MSARSTRSIALAVALAATALAGCSKGKVDSKTSAMISGEGVYREGLRRLSNHDLTAAIESLGRIQYTPDSIERIEPLSRLAVADATFYKDTDISFIDARSLYLDFVTLYGDHPLAPYAQTQAGLCSLRQVNHPTRDQSQTLQAIADLQEVERRYPGSPFTGIARMLLSRARANLAESEYRVGRFYLKRKSYLAAAERFQRVLDEYPDFPETDKVLYYIGRTLVSIDSVTKARIYLGQLVEDYPSGEYAALGQSLLDDLQASATKTEEDPGATPR